MSGEQVLCIVTHPDDEVIGVGGTLARHADRGDPVHVHVLSEAEPSRHNEVTPDVEDRIEERRENTRRACQRLGVDSVGFEEFPDNELDAMSLLSVVKPIERVIDEHEPDTIYTHHYSDLNISHELTCRAVMTAARPLPGTSVERLLAFETLSTSEWSLPRPTNSFQPTVFVDISDQLDAKLAALGEHGEELRDHPHPRNAENVRRNAELWGAKAGVPAAEPFELLREVR